MNMVQKSVVVTSATGLHARPASQLVKFAQKYDGSVGIRFKDRQGDLKSILNVLAMGVVKDSEVTIEVSGENEEQFASEIVEFIENLTE